MCAYENRVDDSCDDMCDRNVLFTRCYWSKPYSVVSLKCVKICTHCYTNFTIRRIFACMNVRLLFHCCSQSFFYSSITMCRTQYSERHRKKVQYIMSMQPNTQLTISHQKSTAQPTHTKTVGCKYYRTFDTWARHDTSWLYMDSYSIQIHTHTSDNANVTNLRTNRRVNENMSSTCSHDVYF